MMMFLAITTGPSCPLIFLTFGMVKPCFPGLVGAHLLPGCQRNSSWDAEYTGSWILVVGFAFQEAYSWWMLCVLVALPLFSGMVYPAVVNVLWIQVLEK